jgi:flagellin-like protein
MKSISPIIASILIIVITVAIAGIFYAFTSGMFGSITSSSSQQIQQRSQIISFTINNVYCSNNILYFNIYNNGNIPININNSEIIFTDNNGNTISINGSNIICNNGNIISIGSNSLCYVINNPCYYNDTNYIKSMNFIYNGINYNYDILNNKFNLIFSTINNSQPLNTTSNSSSSGSSSSGTLSSPPYSNSSTSVCQSSYLPVTIYNTQSISTPSPFQQDIAICNGSINIGNNFAYINNATLFNQINSNGSNIYFTTTCNSTPNIYSWYEGQLINGSTYCDVWWINLPNGIPANSNVTIYMYIGNSSTNYYSQYYPYVGTNEQVIGTMQYDNGQDVFIAYGYFNNTFDGWSGYIYNGSFSPIATSNGIEMLNNQSYESTYILPPNNWNIPRIPLIVEEAWNYTQGGDSNIIALFGNTSQQISCISAGTSGYGYTSNLSTFVQFEYWNSATYLKSVVTNQFLNGTYFPGFGGTFYSYLLVNSSYAQTGYHYYNSALVWAPLTLLDTYNINNNGYTYTYYNLNYNPFQYPTLEISAGTDGYTSYQYVEWAIARAYPPNGVMPSIYIS